VAAAAKSAVPLAGIQYLFTVTSGVRKGVGSAHHGSLAQLPAKYDHSAAALGRNPLPENPPALEQAQKAYRHSTGLSRFTVRVQA